MMRCRIHVVLSSWIMWNIPYLLKITGACMKLRGSLRGTKQSGIVVYLVCNWVSHMRWNAAYYCPVVSLWICDICSSIISALCDIVLRYHTFWSLVAFINLSANYLCSGSFSYQLLLLQLLSSILSSCSQNLGRQRLHRPWGWTYHEIVSFLVRLYYFVRTGRTHIVDVVSLISLMTLATSLRPAVHNLMSIGSWAKSWWGCHCMLRCQLMLHLL